MTSKTVDCPRHHLKWTQCLVNALTDRKSRVLVWQELRHTLQQLVATRCTQVGRRADLIEFAPQRIVNDDGPTIGNGC